MMMKRFMLFLVPGCMWAQTSINTLRIIPTPTRSAVGVAQYWDKTQTHYTGLSGADTIGANITFRLPSADGSAGKCMATDGAGNLSLTGTCTSLSPPITFSGSSASPILTLTQTGAGAALAASGGPSSFASADPANAAVSITETSSASALAVGGGSSTFASNTSSTATVAITQSGSANALGVVGNASITGSEIVSGLLNLGVSTTANAIQQASSAFYITGLGTAFFHNTVSRNVFNSIGDVPLAGTLTISGTTATWASGDVFDISEVGGQLVLCSGACATNLTNGTPFTISAWASPTSMTLVTAPGAGTYSFNYRANAFQTSTGTMQITGGGFVLAQNAVVTNGFTSLGGVNRSGTVNVSGTSVIWVSGTVFDPSMQGGQVIIGGSTTYIVSAVLTPGLLTLTSSGGTLTGVSYSYTSKGFQLGNGDAYIDSSGTEFLAGRLFGMTSASGGSTVSATNTSLGYAIEGINTATGAFAGTGITGTAVDGIGVLGVATTATGIGVVAQNASGLALLSSNNSEFDATNFFGAAHTFFINNSGTANLGAVTVSSCSGCTSAPPITFSGTNASPILTVTQFGSGNAITANGNILVTGTTALDEGVTVSGANGSTIGVSTSSPALSIQNFGAGSSLSITGLAAITGNETVSGTLTGMASAGSSPSVSASNSSTGNAIQGSNSNTGGFAGNGVQGSAAAGVGVFGTASNSAGVGIVASNSGGGLAAHFLSGNVTIDNTLTVSGGCTGCGGVTSVSGTSPIVSSGGTTPAISCPSCITSAVTSAVAGTGVSVSASTGAVTFSIGQAVGTGNSPTFANLTLGTGTSFVVPGWNYLTPGPGNWTAGTYYSGVTAGVTSATCSQFTGGICTAP